MSADRVHSGESLTLIKQCTIELFHDTLNLLTLCKKLEIAPTLQKEKQFGRCMYEYLYKEGNIVRSPEYG